MPEEKDIENSIASNIDVKELTGGRKVTHGNFEDVSKYTQLIKGVITRGVFDRSQRQQSPLTAQQRESLEMIAHKMGRILAGDADFQDHWDDIKGYAHIANGKQGE